MNLNYLLTLFSLSFFLPELNCLFFILDPQEQRCIYREMKANSVFSGTYFISGEHEEGNKAKITNEQGHVLWHVEASKHGDFRVDIPHEGIREL